MNRFRNSEIFSYSFDETEIIGEKNWPLHSPIFPPPVFSRVRYSIPP